MNRQAAESPSVTIRVQSSEFLILFASLSLGMNFYLPSLPALSRIISSTVLQISGDGVY